MRGVGDEKVGGGGDEKVGGVGDEKVGVEDVDEKMFEELGDTWPR